MNTQNKSFPEFPPGFWRRIILYPGKGRIDGALEDDMHSFRIRMEHSGELITGVSARAVRHPWSACAGAPAHLAASLKGEKLADVTSHDPRQECTHLFDLAIVAAAHAHDTAPSQFDMRVADRIDERTTATLSVDGVEKLHWQIDGTAIAGPEEFAGLDIKRLSTWKRDFPSETAEWATLLRRAIFVSGARQYEAPVNVRASDQGPLRLGVCYNYQLPQAEESTPIFDRREFSMSGREPLEDFDPDIEFSSDMPAA